MITISTKSTASAKIAFYLDQAAQCERAAAAATLGNVRERSLRSGAAWRKMASDIGTSSEAPDPVAAASIADDPAPLVAVSAISTATPAFARFG